jgi:agmatinase
MPFDIPHLAQRPHWPVQSIVDPAYAKLGNRLVAPADLKRGGFAFLGVPFEGMMINEIGARGGPDGLRQALAKLRAYSIDLDIDFTETNGLADLGDVEIEYMSYETTFAHTERIIAETLRRGWIPVVAGGSHSITEATLRAFSDFHNRKIGVVWFDGHPDFMDSYKGDKHYCGCPLRRNVESGHVNPRKVAFFGLCGFANAAAEIRLGREMGISFYTMEMFHEKGLNACIEDAIRIAFDGTDAVYVTFDTDALDHTFGPATQYPRPGGFQAFETMRFIRRLGMAGAGAFDATEYVPVVDATHNTGNLLATLFCEFMAGRAHHDLRKRSQRL